MTLLVEVPAGCEPERRYVIELVLGEMLGLEHRLSTGAPGCVRITSTGAGDDGEVLVVDDLFGRMDTDWQDPRWLPRGPLPHWDTRAAGLDAPLVSGDVPVMYGRRLGNGSYVETEGGATTLGLDVFAGAFVLVSRYEEVVATARDHYDEHDRFPASASLAAREGFLERPLVDEYVEILWAVLQRRWPGLVRRSRSYRLWLSHDVDIPRSSGTGTVGLAKWLLADLVRRREPGVAVRRLRAYPAARKGLPSGDPANSFDFIMELSERHGLASAFYFIPAQGRRAVDAHYGLDEDWVRALFRRIHDRGHEIGLHASYDTFRDPARTKQEFEHLRAIAEGEGVHQPAWGGRQHYLRWEAPTTWCNWDAAGLDYDSTMSFHDRVGFRSGTSHEHRVFDLRERRALRLRERPLVAMDATLKGYMGLGEDEIVRRVSDLAARCRMFGGTMSLLWHNHNLAASADQRTYGTLVDALA